MSNELNIIEDALIQAEEDKKELEEIKSAINQGAMISQWSHDLQHEKELKALEIIKDNIGLKMCIDEDVGCLYVPLHKDDICIVGYVKGKDKIDLLKEVLL